MFVRSDLPHVRWVLPDSYLDVKNKTYAGEPFIDGQAVPYDPKYHEIWVRNREASLKSNARNKKRQREPNSSGREPRPSSFASLPGTPSENSMPSDVSENQSLPMSSTRSQNPERASSSAPSVSHQNERPSGHPLNQTAQNSQLQNLPPSALSHNQSRMENQSSARTQSRLEPSVSQHQQNEIPSAHSVNQTPQISQLPNHATSSFSHNQASQYPQMQNRSSGRTPSSHEPAVSHGNEMPSAHPANQTPQTSQLPNRASSSFSHKKASQYPQMQNWSSGWTRSSHEPAVSYENDMLSANPANQNPQTSQLPNHATSSFSHNQASQYPQMQKRSSGWTRSSHEPAVSQENQMPYAHPVNQTPQTSQLPSHAPSSFSHNQASQYSQMQNRASEWTYSPREPAVCQENEMPYAHPVNQTPQTSQLPNRSSSSFSHNHQAAQYSQMQNRPSGWTYSPHEPSPTMQAHHPSWENQNQNWTPRVGYENHAAGGPSQIQNPSSRVFSENHTPHHSQMYAHPSPWTPAPPTPSNTMDMNPPTWSPAQSHGRHPSQIQNPTRDPNYQSWGNQYQNQGGHPGQPAFSQSHTPEYSQMQNQSIRGTPQPPSQPYAVVDENHHNWNNHNWNTGVGPQNQVGVGHPSQMQNPGFSQSQAPQYSQSQVEPSAWATPNHQNWASPYNLPNQSQSWEAAPHQQSRPLQSHDSPHNFSYDYSYGDTSHGVQTGSSQYGHPSNTFQHQAFHGGQSSNAVAPPQGRNHQNMTTPATQDNNFQSTNMGPPQVHNHQFVSAGRSRSIQNDNFWYKMGDPNQQAEYGGTMPSYSNTGDRTQTREYQERDMPVDEEGMYGRR